MLSHPRLHFLLLALLLHLGWFGWLGRVPPPVAVAPVALSLAGTPAIRLQAPPQPAAPPVAPPAPATPAKPKPALQPATKPARPVAKPRREPARRSRPTPAPAQAAPAKPQPPAPLAAPAAPAPVAAQPRPAAAGPQLVEPSFRVPPRPPVYPTPARRRGQEGTVWLEVELDEQGRQLAQRVVRSSGVAILDRAALTTVRQWQFNPHLRDGRPQRSRVRIPIQFQLK